MTTTTVRTLELPSYFRNGHAVTAAIPRGKILKFTSTVDGVDIATATTDKLAGISTEDMPVGGPTRSYQTGGKAMVKSGAAVAIGDRLRPDSQGRGIAATTTGQQTVGIAVSAASAADQDVECEIDFQPYVVPA